MLQALVGKTLETKFSAAYDIVAADNDKVDIVDGADLAIVAKLSASYSVSGTYDNNDAMIQ